jgi:hypothetical protein
MKDNQDLQEMFEDGPGDFLAVPGGQEFDILSNKGMKTDESDYFNMCFLAVKMIHTEDFDADYLEYADADMMF